VSAHIVDRACRIVAEGAAHDRSGDPLSDDERDDYPGDHRELVDDALHERHGIDEEAGRDEEARYEQCLAEELQLALCRMLLDRDVDRQTRQERADDVRQVDQVCKHARHRHDGEHQDEVGVLVVLHPAQRVGTEATEPEQDQRDEDGDLRELGSKPGHGEAGRVGRDADREHDQRQRVRKHRCADRDDDRFEPVDTEPRDDRETEQGVRCEQ
jgi:hypothetical protein